LIRVYDSWEGQTGEIACIKAGYVVVLVSPIGTLAFQCRISPTSSSRFSGAIKMAA